MSGLRRRDFLRGALAGAACTQVPFLLRPAWAGRAALGARSPLLVVVFLRGGADGLALVPPVGDRGLERLRRPLVPAGGVALDGSDGAPLEFALHPALAPLAPLAREGALAVVHAVGIPQRQRSHFEAQDWCELGGARAGGGTGGWLARALEASAIEPGAFRAVAAVPERPLALAGDRRALAFERVEDLRHPAHGRAAAALERLYDAAPPGEPVLGAVAHAGREAFAALDALRGLGTRGARPGGVDFPRGPLGRRLETVAHLARADLGLAAAWVDAEGFDTHVRQGNEEGLLARLAGDLAAGLVALDRALADRRDDLLVLVVTEFGRTAAPNGSGGTDHGRAGAALALGGPVRGGRVHGRWPGLGPSDLEDDRDLRVTTDLRDVLAEGARHLGVRDPAAVFPGHIPRPTGLLVAGAATTGAPAANGGQPL